MSLTQIIAGSWSVRGGEAPSSHKPNARHPFTAALALEFGRSKGHVLRLLSGERTGPLRAVLLRRQRQLLRAAKKEAKS